MKKLGVWGEETAARFLEQKGYRIVERNFRCRAGEIDLIAHHGGCVIFIEVKTRRSKGYGSPAEAVGPYKRRHLQLAIECYLSRRTIENRPLRIDVIEITVECGRPCIRHIRNAVERG
ncbi:MAG TPA: YraN family protein [Clostridiales bacterium]|nr:YraN family protein [Clostridiales bacterium]